MSCFSASVDILRGALTMGLILMSFFQLIMVVGLISLSFAAVRTLMPCSRDFSTFLRRIMGYVMVIRELEFRIIVTFLGGIDYISLRYTRGASLNCSM